LWQNPGKMQIVFLHFGLVDVKGHREENFAKLEVFYVIWLIGYFVILLNIWNIAGCEAQCASNPG
jgi:hypothetical protein